MHDAHMTIETEELFEVSHATPFNHIKYVGREFLCGGMSGIIGIFIGFPFDFVKVRMQTYGSLYSSSFHCLKSSIQQNGFLGLYRGVGAPAVAQGFTSALSFAGESVAMRYLDRYRDEIHPHTPSYTHMLIAGCCGGFLSCLSLVPSDLVKCNMQVSDMSSNEGPKRYKNTLDCTIQIIKTEGILGLYRGFFITALREIPSIGIYFFTYRNMKQVLSFGEDKPSTVATLTAGGLAGVASWVLVYPLDVIKSNMQVISHNCSNSMNTIDTAKSLYKTQGLGVFYRGFAVCLMRAFPVNAASFYFYEYFKKLMHFD